MDESVDKEKALQEFKEKFGLNVNKFVNLTQRNILNLIKVLVPLKYWL